MKTNKKTHTKHKHTKQKLNDPPPSNKKKRTPTSTIEMRKCKHEKKQTKNSN